ncbi:hypothetical protein ACLOJK_025248 [Asimina triloba]
MVKKNSPPSYFLFDAIHGRRLQILSSPWDCREEIYREGFPSLRKTLESLRLREGKTLPVSNPPHYDACRGMEDGRGANSETETEVGWYILGENQKPVGPYAISELQEHFSNGYICGSTLLWTEGRAEWMPLSSIPVLFTRMPLAGSEYSTTDYGLQGAREIPDNDDDFATWQREVEQAEAEAQALKRGSRSCYVGGVDKQKDLEGEDILKGTDHDYTERPLTPPDGEEEFTDDDGTTYKWDRGLRAWVPQYGVDNMTFVDEEEVFATPNAADTSKESHATTDQEEAKPELKRKSPEKNSEKKEANKPPDSWFDLKVNTHAYVTGLPDDVTAEEKKGDGNAGQAKMLGENLRLSETQGGIW